MKIGIGLTTTPNRRDVLEEWYQNYSKISPELPLYIHNDIDYKGVSYSKNKCLNALYEVGCDYFMIFDDDCFITQPMWHEKYVNSGLNHACYTFSRQLLKEHESYSEYVDPNGCMLFFKKICLDTVGGWDTSYTGFGYEHSDISSRIFNAGLTPARFIDIPNSKGLFEMAKCQSSFSSKDRMQIPTNYKLYQQNYYSKEFKPFK